MAQKVKQVGSDTIEIPIQISFKVTKHFNKRLAGRNLSQDNIIEVVRQALPTVIEKNINKKLPTYIFTVCDKQTCIVAIVELQKNNGVTQQTALIRTSYIFDGKGEPLQPNTIFINENNPSPEFEEAMQVAERYGHTWTNGGNASADPKDFVKNNYDEYGNPISYKGYLKYHDPERKEIIKAVNKIKNDRISQQMNQMYADRQHQIDKKKAKDMKSLWAAKPKWDDKSHRPFKDWVRHNTNDALKRADKEILTPYGPNGSLRGIDRKRKKLAKDNINKNESKDMAKNTIRLTESQLKQMISETVKNILKENDDFQAHGYRGTSNWGGLEMQISDSGDAARLRNSITNQVSDWLEIQFDEDGVAYVVDESGHEERLCDYMRY